MARLPLLQATIHRLMRRPSSPPAWVKYWVCESVPSEDGRIRSRAVRTKCHVLLPAAGLLTDAEIIRALRRFQHDPEFRGAQSARQIDRPLSCDHLRRDETRTADAPPAADAAREDFREHAHQTVICDQGDKRGATSLPPPRTSVGGRGIRNARLRTARS